MRIPLSDFGGVVTQTPTGYRPQSTDAGVGQAVSRAGNIVAGAAADEISHERRQQERERLQQERDDKHRQDVAQRAKAALAFATVNSDAADAHDDIARGVMDGSIETGKAEQELSTRITKAREERLKDLSEEQRAAIADNLVTSQGTMMRSLRGVVFKRQQSETSATIEAFGEQQQRVARTDPAKAAGDFAAMVDTAAPAAGWSPAAASKAKQQSTERYYYIHLDAAGMTALTEGDDVAVGEVLKRVQSKEGEMLDPKQRTQLEHQLFGYQQHILAKRAAAANKADSEQLRRENAAVDLQNKAVDITMTGGQLSPEFIKELTTAAVGTSSEKAVAFLVRNQSDISGFATKTAPERNRMLDKMRAGRVTPGVGVDPIEDKFLSQLSTIDAGIRSAVKDDPWLAAQKAGVIQSAAIINPIDGADALNVIKQRMQDIGTVETWAGQKISPLQTVEADTIGKMVRALPPDQAATFLSTLGTTIGNHERVAAVAKQFHDKDGVLGMAMMFASQTTEGRTVAELIMRGDQQIRDKVVKPDGAAETGWQAEIAKTIRGAYSNQEVENQVVKAAFLIAASKGGDIENAVRLATGGGIYDFNGSKIPMPVGYAKDGGQSGAEKRFRREIEKIDPEQLMPQVPDGKVYAAGVPMRASDFLASLPQARLMHAGSGAYWVKAGNTLITNSRDEAIVIRVPK